MQSRPFSYLFAISYFGARYKGWAPQPNQPTVQRRLERVIGHVLGHADFSLIGGSRTDSGVSCIGGYVQLFLREQIEIDSLLPEFNRHLPQDIRLNSVQKVSSKFNLIQAVKQKTYRYYFSNSPSFHPLASAFMVNIPENLNWEVMKEACACFVGRHDFKGFCRPSERKTDYWREIISASIQETNEYMCAIFPEQVFYFEVTGTGFLHHQIRMMMSSIWQAGRGEINVRDIANRLEFSEEFEKFPPAPANGLVLWNTELEIR